MKNSPPMRKWTILSIVIYFILGVKLYTGIVGTTAREAIGDIIIQLVMVFPEIHNDVAGREGEFYAYFCEILLVGLAVFWIIKRIRRKGFYYLAKVFPEKSLDELKAEKRKLQNGKAVFSKELEGYQDMISEMCHMSKVSGIFYFFQQPGEDRLITVQKSGELSVVVITQGYLEKLEKIPEIVRYRVFKFAIAHEIAHVKYRDIMNRKWLLLFHFSSMLAGTVAIKHYIGLLFTKGNRFAYQISVIVLLVWFAFIFSLCNPLFWAQIQEFRADRLALEISGEPLQIFEVYSKYFPDSVMKKMSIGQRMEACIKLYFLILFNKDMDSDSIAHPFNRTRIQELKRGKKWGWTEYVRYSLQFQLNMITGKGIRF